MFKSSFSYITFFAPLWSVARGLDTSAAERIRFRKTHGLKTIIMSSRVNNQMYYIHIDCKWRVDAAQFITVMKTNSEESHEHLNHI